MEIAEKKETETVVHIIAGQDAQKCYNDVEEFCKTKLPENITKQWNTNAIMVGAHQFGSGMQGQVQMILTCIIFWKCSKEQAVSFRNQQKLMLQK